MTVFKLIAGILVCQFLLGCQEDDSGDGNKFEEPKNAYCEELNYGPVPQITHGLFGLDTVCNETVLLTMDFVPYAKYFYPSQQEDFIIYGIKATVIPHVQAYFVPSAFDSGRKRYIFPGNSLEHGKGIILFDPATSEFEHISTTVDNLIALDYHSGTLYAFYRSEESYVSIIDLTTKEVKRVDLSFPIEKAVLDSRNGNFIFLSYNYQALLVVNSVSGEVTRVLEVPNMYDLQYDSSSGNIYGYSTRKELDRYNGSFSFISLITIQLDSADPIQVKESQTPASVTNARPTTFISELDMYILQSGNTFVTIIPKSPQITKELKYGQPLRFRSLKYVTF